MALKAGYKGIKQVALNALQQFVNKYSDSVVIKTIGDGLELTDEGVLNNISSGGGEDFSTTEQDTGIKWIDGSTIYRRVVTGGLTSTSLTIIDGGIIDKVIQIYGWVNNNTTSPKGKMPVMGNSVITFNQVRVNESHNLVANAGSFGAYELVVYYTKYSAEKGE